jgi:hypothetical protein
MEERNPNDKPAYRSACIGLPLGQYAGRSRCPGTV